MFGFVKWENRKAVDYHVGLVRERFQPPKRAQLGDTDRSLWERDNSDPWQLTFFLPLSDPETDELFVYSTTSRGGRDCLANLQEAYADNRQYHPAEAHKLPLVELDASHYQHQDFGRVETPTFDIIEWVEPPANVKQIKPPMSASPLLAIEHVAKPAETKPASEPNDEIPF
jgi:hypothetical protein